MEKLDKNLYISLGKTLKAARERKGYSLQQIGDLIGKHKVSIMRYEKGVSRIDMATLQKLCTYYGIDIADLPKPEPVYSFDDRLLTAYKTADAKTQNIVRQLLNIDEE